MRSRSKNGSLQRLAADQQDSKSKADLLTADSGEQLAAKKAAGAGLGKPSTMAHAGNTGPAALIVVADEFASGLLSVIQAIRATGPHTLASMARPGGSQIVET